MTDLPGHFCPGCGSPQRSSPRYPWHFCQSCLDTATDGAGARLAFANASLSGGLVWRRAGGDWQEALAVRCLIAGRPVLVTEARFGGVVAEPILNGPFPGRITDLVTP